MILVFLVFQVLYHVGMIEILKRLSFPDEVSLNIHSERVV